MGFSGRLLGFCFQFPLQSHKTNLWTVLEPKGSGAKRSELNLDYKFTSLSGRIEHVKIIHARSGCNSETQILDFHATLPALARQYELFPEPKATRVGLGPQCLQLCLTPQPPKSLAGGALRAS
jgi:hypothetical protein